MYKYFSVDVRTHRTHHHAATHNNIIMSRHSNSALTCLLLHWLHLQFFWWRNLNVMEKWMEQITSTTSRACTVHTDALTHRWYRTQTHVYFMFGSEMTIYTYYLFFVFVVQTDLAKAKRSLFTHETKIFVVIGEWQIDTSSNRSHRKCRVISERRVIECDCVRANGFKKCTLLHSVGVEFMNFFVRSHLIWPIDICTLKQVWYQSKVYLLIADNIEYLMFIFFQFHNSEQWGKAIIAAISTEEWSDNRRVPSMTIANKLKWSSCFQWELYEPVDRRIDPNTQSFGCAMWLVQSFSLHSSRKRRIEIDIGWRTESTT